MADLGIQNVTSKAQQDLREIKTVTTTTTTTTKTVSVFSEPNFDINGDGKLDDAEKAAKEAYEGIKKFDINGDGKLDEAELAAKEAYEGIKKFDINGDGKLDDAEKAAKEAYEQAQQKDSLSVLDPSSSDYWKNMLGEKGYWEGLM